MILRRGAARLTLQLIEKVVRVCGVEWSVPAGAGAVGALH